MADSQHGTGACLARMPNNGRRIASLCAQLTLLLGCITACHSGVVANKRPRAEVPTASIAAGSPITAVVGAAWQVDHTVVDWDKLPAEPNPSPLSVAAYGE